MDNKEKKTYTLILHIEGKPDKVKRHLDRLNARIIPAELKLAYPKQFMSGKMSVEVLEELKYPEE